MGYNRSYQEEVVVDRRVAEAERVFLAVEEEHCCTAAGKSSDLEERKEEGLHMPLEDHREHIRSHSPVHQEEGVAAMELLPLPPLDQEPNHTLHSCHHHGSEPMAAPMIHCLDYRSHVLADLSARELEHLLVDGPTVENLRRLLHLHMNRHDHKRQGRLRYDLLDHFQMDYQRVLA